MLHEPQNNPCFACMYYFYFMCCDAKGKKIYLFSWAFIEIKSTVHKCTYVLYNK